MSREMMNMKKTVWLLPVLLSACFPVVMPVANPIDQAPNVYGAWHWDDIDSRALNDTEARFVLNNSDDGFAAVSACNQVSGRYTLGEGQALSFNGLKENNTCAADLPEKSALPVLQSVRSYRFNGRNLELLNESGRVVLSAKRLRNEGAVGQANSGETAYLNDARRR